MIRRLKLLTSRVVCPQYKQRPVNFKHRLVGTISVDTRTGMFGLYPGDLIEIRKRNISRPERNWLSMRLPYDYNNDVMGYGVCRYLVLGIWINNFIDNEPGLILLPYIVERHEYSNRQRRNIMFRDSRILWTRHLVNTEEGIHNAKFTSVPADIRIIYRFGSKHIPEMKQITPNDLMRYCREGEKII